MAVLKASLSLSTDRPTSPDLIRSLYQSPRNSSIEHWAHMFYEAGFDGIFYTARYDPSFTERSVAIFGNQETGTKVFDVVTQPISKELAEAACDEFGFTVGPSAPLL